jgi:acylphosphatase
MPVETDAMIRKTVHYTGRVQGVGFRATAVSIAHGFDVAGYVKNLDDGRVELVAEGSKEQVDAFLDEVLNQLGRLIQLSNVTVGAAKGDLGDPRGLCSFTVRH